MKVSFMKQDFLNFLNKLMEANPELTNELMREDIQSYLNILKEGKSEKPELTENGKRILSYLQNNQDIRLWKAKDLAEQIGISSRGTSGAMRKLVNDGFCDKMGETPVIYFLTEKGKNYEIN